MITNKSNGTYDSTYNHKNYSHFIHVPLLMIHYEHQKLFGKWLSNEYLWSKHWYNYNYFSREFYTFGNKRDIYSLPNIDDVEQVSDSTKFGLWNIVV